MSLFRHLHPLLVVEEATSEDQTGQAVLVLPSEADAAGDHQQEWAAFIVNEVTPGQGTVVEDPVVTVTIETSEDNEHWVEADLLSRKISSIKGDQDSTPSGLAAISALGPYVRASTKVTGDPLPTHTARVVLASNGPFRGQVA